LWINGNNRKAKGTWNSPSPDYYQTTVAELWHKLNLRRVTNS